ncbi:hypothetical protein [Scytonema sp. PRP1]
MTLSTTLMVDGRTQQRAIAHSDRLLGDRKKTRGGKVSSSSSGFS